ncbi:type I phosphomannose isomerase catalytic subunit [Roseibacillus ishigakijimensis]|uniref:Class I mannose-6-phosphate isomerase n=1 Tax=Roseibacillus ishigakijimensis TaxID=454146 RepID=A0A934RPZ7_9BACT|nr:type I phosphomannose isomerase catalytic subunit [Roseibacillus ishigakijimensis]MBK1832974.1 class I mannose-6-phosphate isomerase [Roseibacillus ishigakijimensis]
MSQAPLTFEPLYKTRIWGGRVLATRYHRPLPDEQPYGESWEIVDREEDQSVVKEGVYAGQTLHQLWSEHRAEVFGSGMPDSERFPLLIKILDCQDDLSIQVHPPTELAPSLNGEPKTEMWYLAGAEERASLYIGLKNGVTRAQFEQAIAEGTVAEVVHRIQPKEGESIFIPSGRLHAIGGGNLIFEIQQNSDTTYRVFDWNRLGLDGQPRELHVEESLASIDFDDFEPGMDTPDGTTLARCEYFQTDELKVVAGGSIENPQADRFSLVAVVSGQVKSASGNHEPGDWLLLPKGAAPLEALVDSVVLQVTLPSA